MLLRVRLKGLFFGLSCMVVSMVMIPVAVINSHCQSIYFLKQGGFSLFLDRDRILDLIWEPLVIVMAEYTIPPT